MSLINAIRRPDRVFMVSDGAGLDDNTNLAAIGSKVLSIPHVNAVMGCRGNHLISMMITNGIAADCANFGTFDGLKDYLVGAVRATFDAAAASWVKLQGPHCLELDIIVAGISETRGPDSYLLRTLEGTPTPAWQIVDTRNVLMTPSSDAIFAEVGEALGDQTRDLTDCEIIAAAELQRGYIEPYGSKRIETSWCGAFLQLTTVTESEISSRVIHRWPDQIGKRIRPTRPWRSTAPIIRARGDERKRVEKRPIPAGQD